MTDVTPEDVAKILAGGGVALVPTDTVYGLAAAPDDVRAIRRIFAIKQRPLQRNLPVMVADPGQLPSLGVKVTGAAAKLLASEYMPGPLTLAFGFDPEQGEQPAWLRGREEVAVRIPANPWMRDLLRVAGPLLVTSANLSSQPTQESVEGILGQLAERPDVVVDGGTLSVVPSTLVNVNVEPPRVEREGAVPASKIFEVIS